MKILLFFLKINILLLSYVFSDDIRNIFVGAYIKDIPKRGYTEFKCFSSKLKLESWTKFSKCKIDKNNYYLVEFEYDERFALNENFEGTQISGHPVIIYLSINSNGVIEEINAYSDQSAPFYFRKQAHLLWLRVYNRYGSEEWSCIERLKDEKHITIGKKYINRSCSKLIDNKKITLDTKFYFKNNNKSKDNLVSRSFLKIKFQPNI